MRKDKELKKILEELEALKKYDAPSEEEVKQLSITIEFKERIRNFGNEKNVHTRHVTKIAVIILISVLTIMAGSATVYAYFFYFRQKENSVGTDISIEGYGTPATIEDIFLPEEEPAGYVLGDIICSENMVMTEYYHPERQKTIYIRQMLNSSFGAIDNEDTDQESIIINGMEAIYDSKLGESTLFCYFGGYLFIIDVVDEEVTKKEIIAMAETLYAYEGETNE